MFLYFNLLNSKPHIMATYSTSTLLKCLLVEIIILLPLLNFGKIKIMNYHILSNKCTVI